MSNYIDNLRRQQERHARRKPSKVGKPNPSSISNHNPSRNPVDWRFETTPKRGHFVNEDGVVYMLDEALREFQ